MPRVFPSPLNNAIISSSTLVFLSQITSIATAPASNPSNRHDCEMKAQKVGTALGSLLFIETLFCCYVLYLWIRNYRVSENERKRQMVPKDASDHYPMYTEADESPSQPRPDIPLENYQPLTQGSASRPGYQSLTRKKKRASADKPGTVLTKMLKFLPKRDNTTKPFAKSNGEISVDVADLGGEVYADPYEDSVTAGSVLNPASLRDKLRDKNDAHLPKDVYYHVLEDPDERPLTSNKVVAPLPHDNQSEQERQDVYYYCDTKTKTTVTQDKISESDKDTRAKMEKPRERRSFLKSLSEPSKQETPNKGTTKPLQCNAKLSDHVIQEMKNRAAIKKSGHKN